MKKLLLFFLALAFFYTQVYSQLIVIDHGPLTANSKYSIDGAHWGKNHLKYYIYANIALRVPLVAVFGYRS